MKLRLREALPHTWGHTATKWQKLGLDPQPAVRHSSYSKRLFTDLEGCPSPGPQCCAFPKACCALTVAGGWTA